MAKQMTKVSCALGMTAVICVGACSNAYAEPEPTRPLRSAIQAYGVAGASGLIQSARPVRVPGRSCRARVCAGAAIGAGVGAVFGAIAVGSNGNRTGGAVFGAVIFGILGAGFGYKACGP
jgi:hypothetical protein